MRRLLALALLVAALLPACATEDRPEGLIERWLSSLNQGPAGRPARYASDALSDRVLPDWRDLDPGELDVIEVGKARVDPSGLSAAVPFRVERLDGTSLERTAVIERLDGGDGWRVERLEAHRPDLLLPSEGGPAIGAASTAWWIGAVIAALVFVLLAGALVGLVRRSAGSPEG